MGKPYGVPRPVRVSLPKSAVRRLSRLVVDAMLGFRSHAGNVGIGLCGNLEDPSNAMRREKFRFVQKVGAGARVESWPHGSPGKGDPAALFFRL